MMHKQKLERNGTTYSVMVDSITELFLFGEINTVKSQNIFKIKPIKQLARRVHLLCTLRGLFSLH